MYPGGCRDGCNSLLSSWFSSRPSHRARPGSLHTSFAAHGEHVLGEVGDSEPVPWHTALTVAAQVEGDHPMAFREVGNQGRDVRPVAEAAVN